MEKILTPWKDNTEDLCFARIRIVKIISIVVGVNMIGDKNKRAIKEIIEGIISIGMSFTGAYLGAQSINSIGIWYAAFSIMFGLLGVYELYRGICDWNR